MKVLENCLIPLYFKYFFFTKIKLVFRNFGREEHDLQLLISIQGNKRMQNGLKEYNDGLLHKSVPFPQNDFTLQIEDVSSSFPPAISILSSTSG